MKRSSLLTNISCWLLHLGLSELGRMDAEFSGEVVKGCVGDVLARDMDVGSANVRNIGLG